MLTVAFGPSGRRFRLLETMRQFAAEQLRSRGQTGLVAERHARWCVRQVTDIHRLLTRPRRDRGRRAPRPSCGRTCVPASRWACTAGDPRLADALVRPIATELTLRGRQEIGDWAEHILAMTSGRTTRTCAPSGSSGSPSAMSRTRTRRATSRVAGRHGEPDRALSRYAHAYASGDGEALWRLPAGRRRRTAPPG